MAKNRNTQDVIPETTIPDVDPQAISDLIDTTDSDVAVDETLDLNAPAEEIPSDIDEVITQEPIDETGDTTGDAETLSPLEADEESEGDQEETVFSVALKSDSATLKSIASVMESYNNFMGDGRTIKDSVGASYNYTLYNGIANVIELTEGDEFKNALDFINLVFKQNRGSNAAFNVFSLHRFSGGWTKSKNELKQFELLMVVITTLANAQTRKEDLKTINFDPLLVPSGIITEVGLTKLKAYYNA